MKQDIKTTGNAQAAAEETAKRLSTLYGRKVEVISFNGTPGVMFKDQIEDEYGNSKSISHYP